MGEVRSDALQSAPRAACSREARQLFLSGAHPAAHATRIAAILDGTEPDGLSLEKLYQMPGEWEE